MTHRPNLDVVPINDRVDTNELWPALICRIEVFQELSVWIRPPCPQKYCFYGRPIFQVCF